MTSQEAAETTLNLFQQKPNVNIDEIQNDLVATGIDTELAKKLACFVPIALCRLVFGAVGVQFAPDYITVDDAGNETGRASFQADPVYTEAYDCCTGVLAPGKQGDSYQPIAARSSDYKAIMDMHLQQGIPLKGLSLPPPRLNLPPGRRVSSPETSQQMPAGAKRYMDIAQAHLDHPFVKQFFYEVTLLEWNVPEKGTTAFSAMQFRDKTNGVLIWTDGTGNWRIGKWIAVTGKESPLPVDPSYLTGCPSAPSFQEALTLLESSQKKQGVDKRPWYTRLWKRTQ